MNPWRPLASHYGEGARGDRREGDGGKPPPPERRSSLTLILDVGFMIIFSFYEKEKDLNRK